MGVAYSFEESIKHLQAMFEDCLTKEIIVPLLSAIGFEGIRIEHGPAERGKDLLFWRQDPFGGKEWYACQVKGPGLTGSAAGSDSLRTVINQLQQACDTPFCDTDGNEIFVSKCLLITSSVLSPSARESVMGLLAKQRAALFTRIVDAPELVSLIKAYKPSLLMPWEENLSNYCHRLEETFRLHLDYKALGLQEQPVIEDLYIDMDLVLENEVLYVRPWDRDSKYVAAFEPEEEATLLRIQRALRAHCSVSIQISERIKTITKMVELGKGALGIKQAIPAREIKEHIRTGFDVDYADLAKQFSQCISDLKERKIYGSKIDNRFSDGDLAVAIRTLRIIRTISPCLSRFDKFMSAQLRPGFQEFRLNSKADPCFLFEKMPRSWLLGHAGTGKSTLCRHHTFTLARSLNIGDRHSLIPVIIQLCSYNESLGSLKDVILSTLEHYGMDVGSMPIKDLLRDGRFLIFLDGYDEIPTGNKRNALLSHLSEFEQKYRENHIVVTSRYVDIPMQCTGYFQYHTALFTNEQIIDFCNKWFRNDRDKSERMRKLITSSETFRVLCKNPLYLTLVAALMQNNRPIPERRVEIYRERFDLLLHKWDYARGVFRNKYEGELKLLLLKKLAFSLHQRALRVFHFDDFAGVAGKWLPYKFQDAHIRKEIFNELVHNNALIRQIEEDVFDFGHLSFQEYLVALEIVDSRDHEIIYRRHGQEWWRHVCLLACGIMRNADEVLMRLFESLTQDNSILFFAAEIIAEADWTSEPVVRNVARELVRRYRRKRGVDCLLILLAMRNRCAYRVFFEFLRRDPRVLRDGIVQNAVADAVGETLYDEVLAAFLELSQEARDFLVNLMRRRGTTVEDEYLRRIERIGGRDGQVTRS